MKIKTKNMARPALIVLALVLFIGFHVYTNNDAYKIRRQFNKLASIISVEPDDGIAVKGLESNKLRDIVAPEIKIKIPVHEFSGVYDRQEIVQALLSAKTKCESLSVEFHDIVVEKTGADTAVCRLTGRIKGSSESESFDEAREIQCLLVLQEGEWLFSECLVEEIITR